MFECLAKCALRITKYSKPCTKNVGYFPEIFRWENDSNGIPFLCVIAKFNISWKYPKFVCVLRMFIDNINTSQTMFQKCRVFPRNIQMRIRFKQHFFSLCACHHTYFGEIPEIFWVPSKCALKIKNIPNRVPNISDISPKYSDENMIQTTILVEVPFGKVDKADFLIFFFFDKIKA